MFEDTDNRGQVGIGTLIVFIAMVLVAAIAAGVLVNTAGFLQESAEQTGQEAQGEVSDRLNVVSAFASDTDSDGDYDTLNMTIRKASGSDDITIAETTFTYLGPSATASGDLDASNSYVEKSAISGNSDYLRNESDRVEVALLIDSGAVTGTGNSGPFGDYAASAGFGGSGELTKGSDFTIQLTTASGASTIIEGRIPSTAQDGGTVEV
jgi:flagellin-like protein